MKRFPNLMRTLKAGAGVLFLCGILSAAHDKRPPHAADSHKALSHDVESRKPREVEARKPHEAFSRKAHPVASHPKTKPSKVQNSGIASFISPPHNAPPAKR